jgi:chitinase
MSSSFLLLLFATLVLLFLSPFTSSAAPVPRTLNLTGNSNLIAYWGQDCVNNEPSLAAVCADPAYDAILLSFADRFGNFTVPHFDLADHCSGHLPNSTLLHCPQVGKDIAACQAMGKTVLMSLGGADGKHSLVSHEDAIDLAHQIWNLILGGTSNVRPFDTAVLDGIDLDVREQHQPLLTST